MIISSVQRPVSGDLRLPVALGAIMVIAVLATAIPSALGTPVDAAYAIASKVFLCALAAALLTVLHWWRAAGFQALPARRDLVWLAPPAVLVLGVLLAVVAAGPVPMDSAAVLAFALVALGTGFSEEAFFRGVLVESLRPSGPLRVMLGTTIAFSLLHLAGLIAGASLEATIAQALVGGVPFGLAFAGLRLTTRSIWPLVAIHAVNNFASYLMTGHWEAVTVETARYAVAGLLQLALLLVLGLYGAWFLWHFAHEGRSPGGGPR